MTGYEIYSAWCRERGQVPPTKEWWDTACAARNAAKQRLLTENYGLRGDVLREVFADQREIDRERREGWAYGE